MAASRRCEQCGTRFTPRREHARFCSGPCRVAWGRARAGTGEDPPPDREPPSTSALQWSVAAMSDLIAQLPATAACGTATGRAVIGEAVWQVTMVDAMLIRYYPDEYDGVLADHAPADRELIEGTLAGLRFVRNRMRSEAERASFLGGAAPSGPADGAWRPVPVPVSAFGALLPSARDWAVTRYDAYRAFLAGRPVTETFCRAGQFLSAAAARAPAIAVVSEPAAP